jgi:hypothetical protein
MLWEILTAEVGQFVLEKVLDLGRAALEDYVKDFFKDCIKGSVAAAKADVLKQPLAEAIGQFLKRFVEELQINGVEKPSVDHHYGKVLKRFVRNQAVRPILGKAFETDCKAIAYQQLEAIWNQAYQDPGYPFPQEFDWKGVAKKYVFEVKGIVKGNAELRSLLEIDLQEQQAESLKQMAGIQPEFDVTRYRESILEQYGTLQLESLGSAKYEREGVNYRTVPLWQVFVGQTVRECQEYMPQSYEIPKDALKRLQAEGDVAVLAEFEQKEKRERYFQQAMRSVLEVVGAKPGAAVVQPIAPYLVVLGDPGSGKSTLLRYLAVNWAQQASVEQIPLLIELRRYIQCKDAGECRDFLEFVHRGSNWVGNLDQLQLDDWLKQGKALVMFDGLDEVVDRRKRGMVLKQIHGFTQQYPQASVIVTSRVIGYNADELRNAGFQHFMLQDLDDAQVLDFVGRWHGLTYADGQERERKQRRLEQAIRASRAIQELAGNPLLLTLMAILNRGEELPRDRSRLYEKASEVLLYQWDVETKLLEDPRLSKYPIEIDYRDKQAMLRRVAYFMQANERGLAGNFIRRADLEDCLKDYLKTTKEAANAPSIAALMIDQLRERNFILCHLGGDNYAFVHRTFLEYFCATEIVYQFEKSRVLTFEQLRDEVFGQHWQDETWHEVLRLVCGMIGEAFVGDLAEWLRPQEISISDCLDNNNRIKKEGLLNLLLATDCLGELRNLTGLQPITRSLLQQLRDLAGTEYPYKFNEETAIYVLRAIAKIWDDRVTLLAWLGVRPPFNTVKYT